MGNDDIGHTSISAIRPHHIGQCAAASKERGFVLSSQEAV